jgi:hypothetical protein
MPKMRELNMERPELPNYDESCFWVDGKCIGKVIAPKPEQLNDCLRFLFEQVEALQNHRHTRQPNSPMDSAPVYPPFEQKEPEHFVDVNKTIEAEQKWCEHITKTNVYGWVLNFVSGSHRVMCDDEMFCPICGTTRPTSQPSNPIKSDNSQPEKLLKEWVNMAYQSIANKGAKEPEKRSLARVLSEKITEEAIKNGWGYAASEDKVKPIIETFLAHIIEVVNEWALDTCGIQEEIHELIKRMESL